MTKDKHIYAIKNLLYGGPVTDDAGYSNSLIDHLININRARLLKQKADKYQSISQTNFQTICMPLIHSELSECTDCLNLPEECNLLRSKYKIPATISDRWGEVLKVRTFDGHEIGQLDISSSPYSEFSEDKDPFWFIFDDYIFVVGSNLKAILIQGLFEEPEKVGNYNLCDDQGEVLPDPCFNPIKDSYPLDTNIASIVYDMVLEKLLRYAALHDAQNDARQDPNLVAKSKK